ncbi:NADH-quinone oxidoreductase subunit N [Rubrobacter taiwanensis]|jgi:NADH-quinone oxidoreductase subunit N|uniref:NADH-quinone oxidoreductase subunit N n=1 Tax=Rubrobacter taiwanensis TaxID=185139 RepID=A0A4R1BQ91_9ACTN|nr:NADH-quinone oxidoreductase subunit N [Rubrobacter taiwanensis]TCJ19436.1 NADH-quinone oxidoreductase subunit N [Rubrobacter taiwanensis]
MEAPLITADTLVALIPEILALAFIAVVLLTEVFGSRSPNLSSGLAALGALALAGSATVLLAAGFEGSFFGDGYVVDGFALLFKILVGLVAFFSVLAAARWSARTGDTGEYMSLILAVALGASLLVSGRDLFVIFVSLELATIPSYAMVAFDRRRRESSEGGMKYLLTGVVASSVLLYGLVLIYGVTGSANLSEVAAAFTADLSPAALLGLVLFLSGVAFKLSVVPFHFWTPDAYQGAPTNAAAFLSVAPKMATFALLLRVLIEGMPETAQAYTWLFALLAILSMFAGNLFALRQTNLKRMLAYSSVAHSGYILAAFAALTGPALETAVQAVIVYAVAYAVMNLGAFFVVELVGEEGKSFNGLFRTQPALAVSMAVFMAALVGIPPLSGFWGKAWVIFATAQAGAWVVVGAVIINSVLSVPYYFGVIRSMFFEEPAGVGPVKDGSGALRFSIYAMAVFTVLFAFILGPLVLLAQAIGL